MTPNRHRWAAVLVVVIANLSTAGRAQSAREQLDSRIGPPVPARYNAVRDAKDWQNPSLSVCAGSIELAAPAVKRTSSVASGDLRDTLIKLPVEAWPYGRIVGISGCSLVNPQDPGARARRQLLAEVEAVLQALGLQVNHWPA